MTGHSFCDFVVWTKEVLHIERITLDEALIESALPIAEKFYKLCILPELLGKWYTWKQPPRDSSVQHPRDPPLQIEEDDGTWCHCKERKGGDMVLLVTTSHAQQHGSTWSVLDCLLCPVVYGCVQHATLMCTRIRQEKGTVLMLIHNFVHYCMQ